MAAAKLDEARSVCRRLDTNNDGVLSVEELGNELSDLGMPDADIERLFFRLDTNQDAKVSEEEFVAGDDLYLRNLHQAKWRMPPELDEQVSGFVGKHAHLPLGDYTDLSGGGGCEITDTARRAMSLLQLVMVAAHMTRRVVNNREKWNVKRFKRGKWFKGETMVDHIVTSAYEVLLTLA